MKKFLTIHKGEGAASTVYEYRKKILGNTRHREQFKVIFIIPVVDNYWNNGWSQGYYEVNKLKRELERTRWVSPDRLVCTSFPAHFRNMTKEDLRNRAHSLVDNGDEVFIIVDDRHDEYDKVLIDEVQNMGIKLSVLNI